MGKLNGQVALVTGGSVGLGLASAKALVEDGAKVVLFGRREAPLQAAAAEIGPAASYVTGDVTSMADLDRLMGEIKARHGKLNIVVANAGGVGGGPLATCTEEAFDNLFQLNVKSVFFTLQKALPLLQDGSSIVVIGSVAAEVSLGPGGGAVYCGTKGAVRAMVRSWAAELGSREIRVNMVGPGPTDTPLVEMIDANGGAAGLDSLIRNRGALHRRGRPEEVGAAVRYLCADATWTTGAALYVDGGITAL